MAKIGQGQGGIRGFVVQNVGAAILGKFQHTGDNLAVVLAVQCLVVQRLRVLQGQGDEACLEGAVVYIGVHGQLVAAVFQCLPHGGYPVFHGLGHGLIHRALVVAGDHIAARPGLLVVGYLRGGLAVAAAVQALHHFLRGIEQEKAGGRVGGAHKQGGDNRRDQQAAGEFHAGSHFCFLLCFGKAGGFQAADGPEQVFLFHTA